MAYLAIPEFMNVLVVGINGFIGSAIASSALSKGHKLFGLSRSTMPLLEPDVTYIAGDRQGSGLVSELITQYDIDILVDVIAMTLKDTQPLLKSVNGMIKQYVLISSIDVYRNYELFQGNAIGRPETENLDEDSELRKSRFPYRQNVPRAPESVDSYLDDYDKIPIELAAQKMSSPWTILRLPMVYGPGDRQHRFRWAIKPMATGAQEILLPKAWMDWQSTYGYIQNVGEAVALTLGNTKAYNSIFNIGEQRPTNHGEWAKRIANVVGWEGSIKYGEDPNSLLAKGIAHLDLSVPIKISSNRIRRELGFREIVDQDESLKDTINAEMDD